jgi:hypothetical protein
MTLILSCLKRSLGFAGGLGEPSGHHFHGLNEIHRGGEAHRPGIGPAPSQVSADDPCLLGSLLVWWNGTVVSGEDLFGEEGETSRVLGLEALVGNEAAPGEDDAAVWTAAVPLLRGRTIDDLGVTPWLVIALIFVIYFALGALMDEIAILVIMTPIMYPIVIGLGYDGVWFGVLTIMMLLTGLLTPPVGLITFLVAKLTKVPLGKVFRGLTPFWLALCVAILLVIAFPVLATWLPGAMR